MTGLEKIIEQIQSDSNEICKKTIANAESKAKVISENGKLAANDAYNAAVAEAQKKCSLELEKAASSADALEKRNALYTKSAIINEVIKTAKEQLNCLNGDEYFEAVKTLIVKNKTGEKGELLMSADDIKNMPKDFTDSFKELTPIAADTEKGFILRYGGIELNCTFNALLDSELDSIKDKLYKQIFA